MTLKFDGWPCKTIGHLFYATSSFVHHFIPIGEFKFTLQSGNAQFGSKSTIFLAVWPRNFTDEPQKQKGTSSMLLQALCIISYRLVNSNWSYSPETANLGQIWRLLEPCDLEIWQMTLRNNRAPLLCHFKLYVSFHTHWWIQIWVTVRKRSIWVKIDDFFEPCDLEILRMTLKNNRASLLCYFKLCVSFHTHWWFPIWVTVRKRPIWVKCDDVLSRVTLKFDGWPWKTIGHLS